MGKYLDIARKFEARRARRSSSGFQEACEKCPSACATPSPPRTHAPVKANPRTGPRSWRKRQMGRFPFLLGICYVGSFTYLSNFDMSNSMPRKSSQKGRPTPVKKLLLPLPEELHHQLKLRAVEERLTMREFIAQAIRAALEKGGKRKELAVHDPVR